MNLGFFPLLNIYNSFFIVFCIWHFCFFYKCKHKGTIAQEKRREIFLQHPGVSFVKRRGLGGRAGGLHPGKDVHLHVKGEMYIFAFG